MFSGSERLLRILYDVWVCWKSNMAVINRKLIGNNVHLSSYIHDTNEIATVISMFSGKVYTTIVLRRLPHVWSFGETKMATIDRKNFH